MDAYNLSDADDRLAELVGRAQQGEPVDIIQEGRIVARLTAAGPATVDVLRDRRATLDKIRAVAATLPFDPVDSVAEMRRQARY